MTMNQLYHAMDKVWLKAFKAHLEKPDGDTISFTRWLVLAFPQFSMPVQIAMYEELTRALQKDSSEFPGGMLTRNAWHIALNQIDNDL